MDAGQQAQDVEQEQEVGADRDGEGEDAQQDAAHAVLGDAEVPGRPADRRRGGRRGDDGDEARGTEADQDPRVTHLGEEEVPRVLGQPPHRAQRFPHRADPVDAREEQRRARYDPDRARVVDESLQVELVRDARDLLLDAGFEVVDAVLAEGARDDGDGDGEEREEREEAREGHRGGEPRPPHVVEPLVAAPGAGAHEPRAPRPEHRESRQPVHGCSCPSRAPCRSPTP